jgi:hypothetical protein
MRHFEHLNYFAVIIIAVVFYIFGWLWHSKRVFGTIWAKESGLNMEGENVPMSKMVFGMIGQFISTVIFTIGIGVIVDMIRHTSYKWGIMTALFIAVFFIFPLTSSTIFFKNKFKLFFIEAGYWAIGALLISVVLMVFKLK